MRDSGVEHVINAGGQYTWGHLSIDVLLLLLSDYLYRTEQHV
jgi:hypothetical protein